MNGGLLAMGQSGKIGTEIRDGQAMGSRKPSKIFDR